MFELQVQGGTDPGDSAPLRDGNRHPVQGARPHRHQPGTHDVLHPAPHEVQCLWCKYQECGVSTEVHDHIDISQGPMMSSTQLLMRVVLVCIGFSVCGVSIQIQWFSISVCVVQDSSLELRCVSYQGST